MIIFVQIWFREILNPRYPPAENMASSEKSLLAGIEAGGAKYVCAVGCEPENPIDEIRYVLLSQHYRCFQRCGWRLITSLGGNLQPLIPSLSHIPSPLSASFSYFSGMRPTLASAFFRRDLI